MVVVAKDLPTEWGNDMNIGWTYELTGSGWSSPVVWGERVFIGVVIEVGLVQCFQRFRVVFGRVHVNAVVVNDDTGETFAVLDIHILQEGAPR